MTATNHTNNYNLSQFVGTDRPAWIGDYNGDMSKIDAQMKANADAIKQAAADGLKSVSHTTDLTGAGTSGSPLGVADTIARKSELEQKINSFKAVVSEMYTTKTDFTNLNNAATKTYQFHDNRDQTGWYKLGTWSNTNQADVCAITIYAGNGQNGKTDQNREVRVFIKDSFQLTENASNAFGVTIDRIRNADNAEVQVRATAADSCDVWYKGDATYAAGRYTISIDPSSKWTHSGSFTTSAPSSGTLQTQEYQTYATKSYVDHTLSNYLTTVAHDDTLTGDGTSGTPLGVADTIAKKTDIPDTSGFATTSALTSGLAGKVDKTASQPDTLGLTATELDSLYKDANGIVRVGTAKE
jgi:hypothetical protein